VHRRLLARARSGRGWYTVGSQPGGWFGRDGVDGHDAYAPKAPRSTAVLAITNAEGVLCRTLHSATSPRNPACGTGPPRKSSGRMIRADKISPPSAPRVAAPWRGDSAAETTPPRDP
jgi:hypothetical protein